MLGGNVQVTSTKRSGNEAVTLVLRQKTSRERCLETSPLPKNNVPRAFWEPHIGAWEVAYGLKNED